MFELKNYTHRFLDKGDVYCIVKRNFKVNKKQYMTVPYYGSDNDKTNVLVAFKNYDLCYRFVYNKYSIEKMNLNDLNELGFIMNMPIVTILKMTPEYKFDIYYNSLKTR